MSKLRKYKISPGEIYDIQDDLAAVYMRNYKVKEIRSLERGLEVLKVLLKMRSATLHDLYRETGISKSTLIRILLSLHHQGFVWQRMADGAYLSSYIVFQKAHKSDDSDWLVELVSPFLESLCEKVKWPSVLSSPRLDYMEVIETNSPKSYFDEIPLGPIGYRANMLRSASGRAYISFCTKNEREAILRRLQQKDSPGNKMAWDVKAINRIVKETRAKGYAVRAEDFGGDYEKPREDVDDGRESIAVPIHVSHKVVGCINITWKKRVTTVDKVVADLLPELLDTAQKISDRIEFEELSSQVADN